MAVYSLGYRACADRLLAALALIMADHVAWKLVYLVMAAAMAIPIRRQSCSRRRRRNPIVDSRCWQLGRRRCAVGVVDPFVDFFRRYGWRTRAGSRCRVLLLFILLFKMLAEQAAPDAGSA